uniref:Uncharacterized protein n=1 Tax=Lepeophtheirus salmonis TaxID=72036 RepID=A0A0K2TCE9_LEPSM
MWSHKRNITSLCFLRPPLLMLSKIYSLNVKFSKRLNEWPSGVPINEGEVMLTFLFSEVNNH